jgi:hypothetical protein
MANWVSASTDDYWVNYANATYIGSGRWECGGGPNGPIIQEKYDSPFAPDPYYYAEDVTHYGIKLKLAWNPDVSSAVIVKIFTTQSGYSYYEQTINFPSGSSSNKNYLIEWTPVLYERIIEIRIAVDPGVFGAYYGSTPIFSHIEVDIEGGGELLPTCCYLYKVTGRSEVTIPDPPSYKPPKPPPPPVPGKGGSSGGGSSGGGTIPSPWSNTGGSPSWGGGGGSSDSPGVFCGLQRPAVHHQFRHLCGRAEGQLWGSQELETDCPECPDPPGLSSGAEMRLVVPLSFVAQPE